MSQPIDWLSRLLELMTISGRLELRCRYGAPWQVAYRQGAMGDIVYHVVLSGVGIGERCGWWCAAAPFGR